MLTRPLVPEKSAPIASLTTGDIIRRRRSYDPVTVSCSSGPVAFEIIEARFENVHFARDFSKVEAMVEVTYRRHPAEPTRSVCLRANVPLRRIGQRQELRQRLIQSAVNLSALFDRLNGEDTTTLRAA